MSVPEASTYLAEGFEAASLKVAQLRSILLEHNVPYASNAKKADLVAAFVDGVYAQRAKLLKALTKTTKASGRGIVLVPTPSVADSESVTDAESARSESPPPPPEPKKAAPRKSRSRKSLAVPEPEIESEEIAAQGDQEENEPTEPAPKRRTTRRSSITPGPSLSDVSPPAVSALQTPSTTRRSGRQSRQMTGPLKEESEPEPEALPAADASTPTIKIPVVIGSVERKDRRKSIKVELPPKEEESGFSDYNPFQSGGEEARERKIRRKSSLGVSAAKRRQSELPPRAIPDSSPDPPSPAASAPRKIGAGRKSLPANLLSDRIAPSPDSLRRPPREWVEAHAQSAGEDGDAATVVGDGDRDSSEDEDLVVMDPQPEQQDVDEPHGTVSTDEFEAKNKVISKKLQEIVPAALTTPVKSTKALARRARAASTSIHPTALVPSSPSDIVSRKTIVPTLSTALLLLALFLANWTQQSRQIGFCDSFTDSNVHLLSQRAAIASARECAARHANGEELGGEDGCDASALPLVPFLPKPEACTPCPTHASCLGGALLGCEKEYIESMPFVRSIAPAVADAFNGFPGLGSVAFPPACVPDTEKLRLVGGLARTLESALAAERGDWLCHVGGRHGADAGREAEFGVQEEDIKAAFMQRRDPSFTEEEFLAIFDDAIADLISHGDVIAGHNDLGKRWLAGSRIAMNLSCRGKLAAKDRLHAWKKELGGVAGTLALIAYLRSQINQKTQDNRRVKEIVRSVLSRLQDQAQLHFIDPVQAPEPHIAPAHLRDAILAAETSPAARERLWAGVEKAVEKNANVRTSEAEVQGEVWRVWTWVGTVGRADQY